MKDLEFADETFIKANNHHSRFLRSMTNSNREWIPLCKRQQISPFWIFAICANQIAMSFIWIPLAVLTNPYCKKLGLSEFASSCILSISVTVGFIVPPFVAAWSDSTTLKYGRRRVFMIGGEFLVMIGLMLASFCREISAFLHEIPFDNDPAYPFNRKSAIFYFVTGIFLAYFGGNIANGPGRAMCSDVVPQSQQILVSNICVLDNAIAGVVSHMIGALKLYQYTSFNNETLVLIVSCVFGLVALTVSVLVTPEEQFKEKRQTNNPISLIRDSFRAMDRNLFFVLLAFFFNALAGIQLAIQPSNYIAKQIFHGVPNAPDGLYDSGVSYAQFLALCQTLFQVAYSFLNTKIVHKIGLKKAWIVGNSLLLFVDLTFTLYTNKYSLIIPFLIAGTANIINGSTPYAYVSLVTPPEKLAGGITLIIFFGNLGGVLAMITVTMFLGSLPYFAENTGRLITISSIFSVMSIICGSIGYSKKKEPVEFKADEIHQKEDCF